MRRYARTILLGGVALTSVFVSGCGGDSSILIDDQRQQDDIAPKQEEQAKQEEQPKKEGIWGQVKGVFKGDSAENPTPDTTSTDTADTDSTATSGAGRWNDADDNLQDPDFDYAVKCIKEQNYAEAKHLLLNVTQRHSDSSSAWRWLGDCHYNLLELPEAIKAYQRALTIHPENYFALRGEAFAHLHQGHEFWRIGKRKEAHDDYKIALKELHDCLRVYPGDMEAMYGLSMAAEGASRRLYQNAITQLRANNKELAESDARNCLEVIDEGITASRQRIYKNPEEIGPRSIAGGLFQRRAILQRDFNRLNEALDDITQAINAYQSILAISPNNYLAKGEMDKCQKLQARWEKEQADAPASKQ